MNGGIRRGLGVLVLVVCVLLPVVDLADTWDSGSADTEYTAVVVMLCAGAALVGGTAIRVALTVLGRGIGRHLLASRGQAGRPIPACTTLGVRLSPPLPLRI